MSDETVERMPSVTLGAEPAAPELAEARHLSQQQLLRYAADLSQSFYAEKKRAAELEVANAQLTSRLAELSARDRVLGLIVAGEEEEHTLTLLLKANHDILGWRTLLLYLLEARGSTLVPKIGVGDGGESWTAEDVQQLPGLPIGEALVTMRSAVSDGTASLLESGFAGVGVVAVAPIMVDGECVGLIFGTRSEPVAQWNLAQLEAAANQAALAISRTRSIQLLEQKVAQRTAEWADAFSQLQQLHRVKDDFLSLVSHELRTPLASITALTDNLLAFPDEKSEVRTEFLSLIRAELGRLSRMIESLLDLSRITAGKMTYNFQFGELGPIVGKAAALFEGQARAKGITLAVDLPAGLPKLRFDRDKIAQVLVNLLSNALKFTPGPGAITISTCLLQGDCRSTLQIDGARGVQAPEDLVLVSVKDTGIGIKPENYERIFEPFVQIGDLCTDKPPGAGLGLAICRGIVERHGGSIWVESQLGRGSTFCFTMRMIGIGDNDLDSLEV